MAQKLSKKDEKDDGSPEKGEPFFLMIGRVRKPHGVKGEILIDVLTEFPERIKPGKTVFIGEKKVEQQIETVRSQHEGLLLKFCAIHDRETAGQFRTALIYVRAESLPKLGNDQYYFHELIDMQVQTEGGEILGKVNEILETGANDVLIVKQAEKEVLLPFIKQVVLAVDQKGKTITVKMQEWK